MHFDFGTLEGHADELGALGTTQGQPYERARWTAHLLECGTDIIAHRLVVDLQDDVAATNTRSRSR